MLILRFIATLGLLCDPRGFTPIHDFDTQASVDINFPASYCWIRKFLMQTPSGSRPIAPALTSRAI
ncbi:hypothetical protein CY34DRAFT_806111 [Suillus luteus UH-Slu-Lm8-n1]|uniref:Uncharacterized protein n=1 Tax=Suillus luteus UH-Slu-Lm8-n1 TaxID=930992 RepID=A0A0C9ZTZ0_9AGAM|nr:hypothetical protein CY34DRAFT_806111 [Suillus luteus UH-Slu-Lm8-n1]